MTSSIVTAPARRLVFLAFAIVCWLAPLPAQAGDFALSLAPPRFELAANPGQTVRGVAELANAADTAADLRFETAEWDLTPDGGVVLGNTLKPDSCRPWVSIERRQTVLQAKGQLRYRFEVTPPADTPPMECRFAIVISSNEQRLSPADGVSVPVVAQLALIVYVTVGDIKPNLRIVKVDVADINGTPTPVLMVENTGLAHGRLSAFLRGKDAKGVLREFAPATLPILPGETRRIALNVDKGGDAIEAREQPEQPGREADPIAFPLTISGTINDSVSSFQFDGVFEP
ncbi:hypothetical protein IP68_08365 [Blastomonas sp. AAP25]|uniref:hypothetical protein n=1 Tax=Blastomonas sp. AAP25 TaxID=1523416 RepID=UPI0006B8F0D6|nr:hypothetical protein [Blastomonas sp. AAP25]KPF75275.1 hypothetical protein IP68_08365 [Blastomonas sp. AAP25]